MRVFLSRLLMKAANQLYWWSESLEGLAQTLQNQPKVSANETNSFGFPIGELGPHPRFVKFYMEWLKANGFPDCCQECGRLWRTIKTVNLEALVRFDDPLPDELVGLVKLGDDRGLILYCGHGHHFAGCYDTSKEVGVSMEA